MIIFPISSFYYPLVFLTQNTLLHLHCNMRTNSFDLPDPACSHLSFQAGHSPFCTAPAQNRHLMTTSRMQKHLSQNRSKTYLRNPPTALTSNRGTEKKNNNLEHEEWQICTEFHVRCYVQVSAMQQQEYTTTRCTNIFVIFKMKEISRKCTY